MPDTTSPSPRGRSHLLLGILLLVIGAVLLAANLGYFIPFNLWYYWPAALILIGLAGLVVPSRHLSRPGGLWLLASGLYCQIGVAQWFGLGWASAWPLFLIAGGINMIFFSRRRRHAPQQPVT